MLILKIVSFLIRFRTLYGGMSGDSCSRKSLSFSSVDMQGNICTVDCCPNIAYFGSRLSVDEESIVSNLTQRTLFDLCKSFEVCCDLVDVLKVISQLEIVRLYGTGKFARLLLSHSPFLSRRN